MDLESRGPSGDDYSDVDDPSLVSVAPRRRGEGRAAAPASAIMQRAMDASALGEPLRCGERTTAVSDLRMRRVPSVHTITTLAADGEPDPTSAPSAADAEPPAVQVPPASGGARAVCQSAAASESLLSRAGLCGVATDAEIWTFVAGLLLYAVSG